MAGVIQFVKILEGTRLCLSAGVAFFRLGTRPAKGLRELVALSKSLDQIWRFPLEWHRFNGGWA